MAESLLQLSDKGAKRRVLNDGIPILLPEQWWEDETPPTSTIMLAPTSSSSWTTTTLEPTTASATTAHSPAQVTTSSEETPSSSAPPILVCEPATVRSVDVAGCQDCPAIPTRLKGGICACHALREPHPTPETRI
eukprot:2652675-Rhodomonas_salina.1